jgi:uncharacterized phage protein (TIGR01671 family)
MKAEEIKFRVWNGTEMVYDVMVGKFGIFYVNPANNGMDENDSACLTPANTKYPDDIPVMQYTGLRDMIGVKIYEGDKFQYRKHKGYLLDDFIGVVKFKDGCFGYECNRNRLFTPFSEFDELKEDFLDHIEVVGNVHDKQQQKQALIDMMRGDEEIGLYDDKINNNELHTN